MTFTVIDLKNAIHRKKVLQEEIDDCYNMWGFVDDQLNAELALAQCEIDWCWEKITKYGIVLLIFVVLSIIVGIIIH
jgi:hypothetical protein